jgi:hypothetical protein
MLVALMLWLWQTRELASGVKTICLLALNLLLTTFRADVACLLNAGILLFVVVKRSDIGLPRRSAIAVSLMAAISAAGIQLWLIHVAFPQAGYGRVKILQLWPNVKHATRWPPFVFFLLPLLWMLIQVVRRRFAKDAIGLAFLAGALVYTALWVTIGKIDEVRIFMPFALALVPLTTQMAMLRLHDSGQ